LKKTEAGDGGQEGTPMVDVRMLPVGEDNEMQVTLDDLAREGALRMIAAALEAEVEEYIASFVDERDEDGKRLVIRNGKAKERKLAVGSGTLAIRAPRVNDKRVDEETGERKRFSSRILPAYATVAGDRGATDPVPAWALDRRLRAPRLETCWARTRRGCRRVRSSG